MPFSLFSPCEQLTLIMFIKKILLKWIFLHATAHTTYHVLGKTVNDKMEAFPVWPEKMDKYQ